jgi:Zn-dependent protease with chaperone function
MTAFLLVLVIAQPAEDEPPDLPQKVVTQMAEAYRIMVDDPAGALRLLNELIEDLELQERKGPSRWARAYREQALYCRGQIQLEQGQAQAVVDDMTALLEVKKVRFLARVASLTGSLAVPLPSSLGVAFTPPYDGPLNRMDWYAYLQLRAQAYEQLGMHDREQADHTEARDIINEMMHGVSVPQPQYSFPPEGWWPRNRGFISWFATLLLAAAAFVVMVPVFFLKGLRQRREAGGTWGRLFWVALVLTALQTAPVLAAGLLLWWRPELFYLSSLLFVTFLVFVINVVRHFAYLTPVKWALDGGTPPLLKDEAILGRIAQIAGRMGIAAPTTRLVRSAKSLQTSNALISGLVAPTMVLYDGILYRLTEEERDAIIAHELAHLANRTFWCWLAASAVCSLVTVTAAAFYSSLTALGLGLALVTGARLILGRWLELDCDRRSARAIGHRRTFTALRKIHADQPYRGLLEFLIGAVSSHPSRDQRLAAIRRDASGDDRPEVEWDERLLRHRRLAAWGAAGLWLGIIGACLFWGWRWRGSNWPAIPLLLVEVGLVALFWLGVRKSARRQRLLKRTRASWLKRLAWLVPTLLWCFLIAHFFGLTETYLSSVGSLVVVVALFLVWLAQGRLLGRGRAKKLNRQLLVAIQSGDYPQALALAENNSAIVAGSTELRYNYALIRAVLGRREEALKDLERLRLDEPGFKMTWLLLASIYADEEDYARALELAAQLSQDLPGDPIGPQAEAWLLRRLGRLEQAETRARQVLEMEPRSGLAYLTLAGVALDRGDHAAAQEQLAQAERIVPGSVNGALLAAEIALATGEGAEAAVDRAVQAAKNNALSFSDRAAARLAQRLEARQTTPQ